MSGIDMDNPAWERLIYALEQIAADLEELVNRQ
jgi:hypothetical protein